MWMIGAAARRTHSCTLGLAMHIMLPLALVQLVLFLIHLHSFGSPMSNVLNHQMPCSLLVCLSLLKA
jgi:hypothetical protein